MNEFLIKEIKGMSGYFLSIGSLNDKVQKAILNNDNILTYSFLEKTTKSFGKKKLIIRNRSKKVNIKKIRKVFKKKRVDNIICDYNIIDDFTKTFVRDSVYINKGKLYIYGSKTNLEKIMIKYQRYTKNIILKKVKNNYVLIIDNSKAKNNKIKDIGYWWIDTFNNFIDILTLILVN